MSRFLPWTRREEERSCHIWRGLQRGLRLPILYASHALEEVIRLADHVVLLEAGRVVAAGPLGDVATGVEWGLAARDDAAGVLRGQVASHEVERRLSSVACGGDLVWVPLVDAPVGATLRLVVPAREVILALDAPRLISVSNVLPAVVIGVAEDTAGHAALVSLELGGGQLLARVTLDAGRRLGLSAGRQVLALVKAMSVELVQE